MHVCQNIEQKQNPRWQRKSLDYRAVRRA